MAARTKAKRRAPLMESDTEAALRRRGKELVGLILVTTAALAAVTIWTYSPDDPSLFSATDAPPQNALGLIGASLADPLHRALGLAAYGISVCFGVWGLRLLVHKGETRAISRSIAAPFALLIAAAFAATHVPPKTWAQDYGLGGLLGDATLGALLSLSPLAVTPSLRLVTALLAIAFIGSTGYVLGVTWGEARGFVRFLGQGSVTLYSGLFGLTGRAARGAARARRAVPAPPPPSRPSSGPAVPIRSRPKSPRPPRSRVSIPASCRPAVHPRAIPTRSSPRSPKPSAPAAKANPRSASRRPIPPRRAFAARRR